MIKSRYNIFRAIYIKSLIFPEAAQVSLDIACDDMKEEIEDEHYRLRAISFAASAFCFIHIVSAVFLNVIFITAPSAIAFCCVSIHFGRRAMACADISTATTLIITDKNNVPPYCGANI